MGTVPDEPIAADPDGDPVLIGLINQEDTPLGSFPELRVAAEASVEFINTELGGVGGRPLELTSCVVSFDPEQSQACAQEMVQQDVVALTGGIDVTSNGSIPVLEQNGIPQAGGIPANLIEQRSETMFFFSGGTTGAVAAFLSDAADKGAESRRHRLRGVRRLRGVGPRVRRAGGREPRHRRRTGGLPGDRHRLPAHPDPGGRERPRRHHHAGRRRLVRAAHGDVRRDGDRGPALPGGRLRRRRDHRGRGRRRRRGHLQLRGARPGRRPRRRHVQRHQRPLRRRRGHRRRAPSACAAR